MIEKKLKAGSGFYLLLAIILLCIPVSWIIAVIAAAAVHEAGHYLAVRLLSGKSTGIRFFAFSAQMRLPQMGVGRELLCALAGPFAGMLLLLFSRWIPRIAICALCQSIWNLLPLYPLDGGRCLLCILKLLFPPPLAQRFYRHIVIATRILIVTVSVFAVVYLKLGMLPLLLAGLILFRTNLALQTERFRSTIEIS